MQALKNSILLVLFLLAIGLTGRSLLLSKKNTLLTVVNPTNQPDAYIDNVVATIFNQQGATALRIEAPKMVHFHKKDTTQIETPHITIYRQSPEPWHIRSGRATATHGIDEILFWDNVTIFHEEDHQNPATTIKTAQLTIFPNQEIAKTDQPVTLSQPNTSVFGTGMFANMKLGSVKLLSEARSNYVPSS